MVSIKMIFVGFLMFQNIYAQKTIDQPQFFPPLDIPLYLSGNFGELRSGHFHSGLDFKTQGVTGKKVYSVKEGYVSRIKVQTQGYGNSIYITHPGGLTSVYGHLERFNDTIAKYVRAYQYQNKTQTIDIYPDKELFKISKGEVVAFSGNSGSSGGPHLHFELRGSASQHTLNGLLYGFDVKDNLPPQILKLYVYPLGETPPGQYAEPKTISVQPENESFHLTGTDTITLKGDIGFGLEAVDYLNEISNQCGIYSIELSVNDQVIYLFRIDEFSFNESPSIKAHQDYHALVEKNKKIHLLYIKPNNRLSLYPLKLKNGIVNFNPEEISKVDILVKDAYGNASRLNFYVKANAPSAMSIKPDSISNLVFKWNAPNYYENSQIRLSLGLNSLYEDCLFNYSRTEQGYQGIYPFTHYIGDEYTPINKPMDISFSGEIIPESIRKKVMIAMIEESKIINCLSSTWNGDRVSARSNKFGKYTLVVDTLAPVIVPINFVPGTNLKSNSTIQFKITDLLSGIGEYQGYIDDSWALFEYDPKNDLIVYNFDPERLKTNIEHKLVLRVKDAVGNLKTFEARFWR